jgi:hypothetical protein
MTLNLSSLLGSLVSSAPISPKVAAPVSAGGVAAAVLALIHQYGPGVQLPSLTTMTILITALMGVVGYLVPHSGTPSKSASVAAPPAAPVNPPGPPPGQ